MPRLPRKTRPTRWFSKSADSSARAKKGVQPKSSNFISESPEFFGKCGEQTCTELPANQRESVRSEVGNKVGQRRSLQCVSIACAGPGFMGDRPRARNFAPCRGPAEISAHPHRASDRNHCCPPESTRRFHNCAIADWHR